MNSGAPAAQRSETSPATNGASKKGAAGSKSAGKTGGSTGGRPPGGLDENAPPIRFGVIGRLGKTYFGRHLVLIGIYIVASLGAQAVLQPAIATRFGDLTNATVRGHGLVNTYVFWVVLTLSYIALGFCLRYVTTALDLAVSNAMRRDVFVHILRQGPRFFHDHDEGELTMIVNQICGEAESGLRHLLVDPVLQLAALASIGATLYVRISRTSEQAHGGTGPLFALVAVAAVISPWLVSRMGKRLQRAQVAMQRQGLGLASLIGGAVKAPEEIQAMRAEGIFDQKHVALLEELRSVRLQGATTLETLNLFNRLPGDTVLCILLGMAVYLSLHGGPLDPGTLVAVALLTPQFMMAVQSLGGYSISLSMGWPAIALVNDMLGSAPASQPNSAAPSAASTPLPAAVDLTPSDDRQPGPTLEVENLTFSYVPGELPAVLNGVSFAPTPGRITGLVARAGEGKTTFFRLGMRFYDPQSGVIRLDGVSHVDLPLSELRRRVVLMAQFPAFFGDSVRENFLLAKPGATDEEIRRFSELTGIWPILERCFPQGNPLDAPFHGGSALSGGQKKLFALTRCLLREPNVLFLDEPTTGMDPDRKFEFLAEMRASCEGRTVLVVDHDILWQLRFCDEFLVLDGGHIAERGTARELLIRHGVFRELFDKQTEGIRELLRLLDELDLTAEALANPPPTASADGGVSPSAYAVENR